MVFQIHVELGCTTLSISVGMSTANSLLGLSVGTRLCQLIINSILGKKQKMWKVQEIKKPGEGRGGSNSSEVESSLLKRQGEKDTGQSPLCSGPIKPSKPDSTPGCGLMVLGPHF